MTNTIHVIQGKKIDPTIDKNYTNWTVESDPPPDVHLVYFSNPTIEYFSYDPPKGFTAEEIMKFNQAAEVLTLAKAEKLIEDRNRLGTLMVQG